jgi:hypothetical protein
MSLKMEAVYFSETLISTHMSSQHNHPEDQHRQFRRSTQRNNSSSLAFENGPNDVRVFCGHWHLHARSVGQLGCDVITGFPTWLRGWWRSPTPGFVTQKLLRTETRVFI